MQTHISQNNKCQNTLDNQLKNINQINKDGRIYVELASLKQAGYNIGYNSVKKTASFAKKPEEIDILVNNESRKINRVLICNEN